MSLRVAALLAALLAPAALAAPEQVHLGLPSADAATARSVLWVETDPLAPTEVVLHGPEERRVAGQRVPGPSVGIVYEAQLGGLAPGAAYTYDLGGRTFGFAMPPAELPGEGVRFVALGDMGVTSNSTSIAALVQRLDPAFVLHAGDISYAEGDPLAWKAWFDIVEPVAATRPWVTALGNHEVACGPGPLYPASAVFRPCSLERDLYVQRFGLPGNEVWYSFDWAGVHVVVVDTYSEDFTGPPSPAQLAWLEEDLRANQDATWTLALLHEPPYSSHEGSAPDGTLSSLRVQEAFVPLWERYGVDVVLGGHVHVYERSHPLRAGTPMTTEARDYREGEGTVYVVTGGAGESLTPFFVEPAPAWLAARAGVWHVVEVTATPSALALRLVPLPGQAGALEDGFRIVKESDATRPAPGPLVAGAALALLLAARARKR